MAKKKIVILGAGLAGLSAAWHLQKKCIEPRVFEAESEVGGLCRSKTINGFTFDCDGHILHFKREDTFNFINSLLSGNLLGHKRSAWIYSHQRYIRYPFQANLYGLPHPVVKECLLGYIHKNGLLVRKEDLTFADWIAHSFGMGIAKHFMVPYNTKFWTVPPRELTCEWLGGFIPVPSLGQVIEGTIEESRRQFGYNAHFWYPKTGGINQLPLALASQIKNIYTNCRVSKIDLNKKEVSFDSGAQEKFDFLISTIPLPEMPGLIKGMPTGKRLLFKQLRWNSVFNLNLGIEKKDYFSRHWAYFPQKSLSFFRVGFFHNFSSSLAPAEKTSMYVEASYSKDKPIDKKNILSRIQDDLIKIGLLSKQDKICAQDVNDIKYGYPIYDKNYRQARKSILEYLSQNNIFSVGRYGSWRYLSMEDVILDGKVAASCILENV